MSQITRGQAGIQTAVLLSIILLPIGFYIWLTSGLANLIGGALWGIGGIIYAFCLIIMSMKLPEKHRRAVEGKNFLDIEVYRNKEESQSYFFGVAFHQPLKISELEAASIEEDEKFIQIRQSCIIESEKQLIEWQMEQQEQKELLEKANIENFDDTLELDPKESHEQIREMEGKINDEMNDYIDEQIENINNELKKVNESIDTLKQKIESIEDPSLVNALEDVEKLESMRPKLEPSDKNMVDMTYEEMNFRLLTLEQCEQNMFNLAYDDMVYVLQYRLFQVRRIFQKLLSEDVYVEMLRNYQPVTYFNSGIEFERFVLIMRRPFIDEFSFKQVDADHEGYPISVQSAKATVVTCGWVNSKIPIFIVINSPADAFRKMDVVYDAKQLQSVKEQILVRLVHWYKMEYEQSEYSLEEERAYSNLFVTKFDELKQKLEEIDYKPDTTEYITNERIVTMIPSGIKVYALFATIGMILFLVLFILYATLYMNISLRF